MDVLSIVIKMYALYFGILYYLIYSKWLNDRTIKKKKDNNFNIHTIFFFYNTILFSL